MTWEQRLSKFQMHISFVLASSLLQVGHPEILQTTKLCKDPHYDAICNNKDWRNRTVHQEAVGSKLWRIHNIDYETAIKMIAFGLHALTLENVHDMFLDKESRLLKNMNGMLMTLIILVLHR